MAKDKSRGAGLPALDRSPSHLLHRALQVALDIYGQELGAEAITQRQFAVLSAAAAQEGATQADLVRATGIDRSTLADMAARMISKGFLARERSVLDGRANTIRITDAGRAALLDAAPKVAAADARLLKRIAGGGRKDTLLKVLRDLIEEPQSKAKGRKTKDSKKKLKLAEARAA
ncbi:MarR family winged helix-turn-helix transcriptional regulator [Phenylobacterium immobile]|uniref:MarR family winged helix-turn-helix transcriptional regulator n=1 Tax=Phenylobacterium immobile TaxID=21 RepID=UPI000B078530|nr:MarR family winged helix-turn-helix transcriptional regulator [Phenylobacterium immobile]